MKTRIATSLGIALVLVFGVVGVMVAFGPLGAQASHGPVTSTGDLDDIGNMVSGVKVEAIPNSPNTVSKWTVQFMNGTIQNHTHSDTPADATNIVGNMDEGDNVLDGGTGKDVIRIEFEDDVQFPESLSPSDVTITTDMVSNAGDPDGDGTPNDPGTVVANPLGVDLIKVSQFAGASQLTDRPPDETLVTLEIPDMVDSDDHPGSQGIAPGAMVTVVFRQTAGIKNPTESKADEVSKSAVQTAMAHADGLASLPMLSGYMVQVSTSNNGYFVPAAKAYRAVIPRLIVLNDNDGPPGQHHHRGGRGFRNSITATVWNDKNQNGLRDGGEIDLANALITGSDDFTTTVTINNPPFNYDLDTNGINAVDGRNRTIIPGREYMLPISGATVEESIPRYMLESSVKLNPSTAAIGDSVQVIARDFVAGGVIRNARISIGGVPVIKFESDTVSGTGDATFEMTIPNDVASGTQNLVISNGTDAAPRPCKSESTAPVAERCNDNNIVNTGGARFNMVISGALLSVTPGMGLVPNQTVTLAGRGFSTGGRATINDDYTETVGGVAKRYMSEATISGSGIDLEPGTVKLNEGDVIDVDNAGNWSSSFVIPITDVTTTAGDQELSITDTEGRSGAVTLNMAERTLTLTPASGRVGTRVDVMGSGFPADNPAEGGDSTVTVEILYSITGAEPRTVATLTPDGSGNIRGWFTVPLGAGIPSTNAVRAEYDIPATGVNVTTSAVHQVPRAGITLDQEEGPAGTVVTITGGGFKRYTTVSEINFGTLDVRSGFGLSTDGVGGFETTFLVPGANTGAQAVSVKVGETTASATFTVSADVIVATPSPAAQPMPPADALAALIANDNNLVRVWQFDASAQEEAPDFGWSLYDPRPLFADANTIEMVSGGNFYWINVQNEQTAVLGGMERTLFAGWNPVTW